MGEKPKFHKIGSRKVISDEDTFSALKWEACSLIVKICRIENHLLSFTSKSCETYRWALRREDIFLTDERNAHLEKYPFSMQAVSYSYSSSFMLL